MNNAELPSVFVPLLMCLLALLTVVRSPVQASTTESKGVAIKTTSPVIHQSSDADALSMHVPSSPADCDKNDPWHAGRWELPNGGYVPSGGCMSLRYSLAKTSRVLLLHQGPTGALQRLYPEVCGSAEAHEQTAGVYRYPQLKNGVQRIIELDDETGKEAFHLAVVDTEAMESPKQQRVDELFTVACRALDNTASKPLEMNDLREMLLGSGMELEWSSQVVNHY